MIAAHHIALLLLSTATEGSEEHRAIIEQNGPGVWLALAEQQLVERDEMLWRLSERGRVFVDYVLSLPLPQLAWRMPGQQQPVMPVSQPTMPAFAWGSLFDGVDPRLDPNLKRFNSATEPLVETTDEPQPPPPAPVSMLPKVDIPTDPLEISGRANQLLNSGYSLNEVQEMLKLTPGQARAIFEGAG